MFSGRNKSISSLYSSKPVAFAVFDDDESNKEEKKKRRRKRESSAFLFCFSKLFYCHYYLELSCVGKHRSYCWYCSQIHLSFSSCSCSSREERVAVLLRLFSVLRSSWIRTRLGTRDDHNARKRTEHTFTRDALFVRLFFCESFLVEEKSTKRSSKKM